MSSWFLVKSVLSNLPISMKINRVEKLYREKIRVFMYCAYEKTVGNCYFKTVIKPCADCLFPLVGV